MSRTPFFFVERFNFNTNQYELQHPYVWNDKHDKLIPAELFPYNGCHELFAIVEERAEDAPNMQGIHNNLPKDVSKEIKEMWEKTFDEEYNLPSAIHWFTYADMYIYLLKNPKVRDYDVFSEEGQPIPLKDNPLTALKERVDAFMEVVDGWDWQDAYSLIRIVYWIF